jgi:hypothetical protein
MKWKLVDIGALIIVAFAFILGAVVRFFPVFLSHFPLNDGGLFYRMAQDILEHHFALPAYTSYNGGAIPFGYPPLPFYLVAFLQKAFHFDILAQLRFLPALFSTLCIPAFYFLSKAITGSTEKSVFAAFAYALIPDSYIWLIMGGGISRSLGVLFAILSILFVWEMFKNNKVRDLLLASVFCSLTILSHPSISVFVFMSALLIFLFYGRNKKGLLYAGLTIIGVLLVTSPWSVTIIQRYGISLLTSAFGTGGIINLSIITFFFLAGSPFSNIFSIVALFGLFAELARRKFFVFIWLMLISILSVRSAEFLAIIPGSLLFGSGVVWVLTPGLLSYKESTLEGNQTLAEIMRHRITKITFGVILIFGLFSAMATPLVGNSELKAVSLDNQAAMEWAAKNTPANSQFAILTGDKGWHSDPVSEWFPAMTRNISVSTVQGTEWLPNHQFDRSVKLYNQLQTCSEQEAACILSWARNNDISFTYLYIAKQNEAGQGVSNATMTSLLENNQFQLAFDNPGASIYKVDFQP